jgi:tripartite-type tricarboxylate transporter receptor subunit TctC
VQSGALRGLAVITLRRSTAFPNLPTVAESPGFASYDASTWGGILAPAGTPKEVIGKLHAAINDTLRLDDVRTRLIGAGIEIPSRTPEHVGAVMRSEVDKCGANHQGGRS